MLELKNICYEVGDDKESKEILKNVNLTIDEHFVAITGPNGGGKSTLAKMIAGIIQPTSGQILIDGVDYRERSYLWLQSNLSYVLQTPHLFSGTILENIKYANPEATMEQVIAAAKKSLALPSSSQFILRGLP